MNLVIHRTLEFDAAPERVWRAITDPVELSRWFPDRAELELSPGGKGSFAWDEHGAFEVEVVSIDEPRYFAWRWAGGEERPLQEYSTLVEWTLEARADGGTTLHVQESGFDSEKGHADNSQGWDAELGELVDYLKQ